MLSAITLFDVAAVTIVGICFLLGLFRGAVDEIFSLLGWVIAFIVANMFAKDIADMLSSLITKHEIRVIVAYLILFASTLIIVSLLKLVLSEFMRAIGLGPVDKFFGAAVGFVKGTIIALIIVIVCGMTSLPRDKVWKDSMSAKWFETLAVAAKPWLPHDLAKKINFRSSMKA